MRSLASNDGSTAANKDAGVPAGKVGATGAKFKVGWGRVRYRTFSFLSKLMKYSVLNGGTAWNCAAFEKFQPGEPLALIMPSDNRFWTESLPRGT